jgi:hypothetical protein
MAGIGSQMAGMFYRTLLPGSGVQIHSRIGSRMAGIFLVVAQYEAGSCPIRGQIAGIFSAVAQ